MASYVVDSSVILAILRSEMEIESVEELVIGAGVSSVNLAEVVTKCVEQGIDVERALAAIAGSKIESVSFDNELAVLAGKLRERAPKGVLSLGDRACIATAIRSGAVAVTADRIWGTLDLGCDVVVVR